MTTAFGVASEVGDNVAIAVGEVVTTLVADGAGLMVGLAVASFVGDGDTEGFGDVTTTGEFVEDFNTNTPAIAIAVIVLILQLVFGIGPQELLDHLIQLPQRLWDLVVNHRF